MLFFLKFGFHGTSHNQVVKSNPSSQSRAVGKRTMFVLNVLKIGCPLKKNKVNSANHWQSRDTRTHHVTAIFFYSRCKIIASLLSISGLKHMQLNVDYPKRKRFQKSLYNRVATVNTWDMTEGKTWAGFVYVPVGL